MKENERIYCNKCQHETSHTILNTKRFSHSSGQDGYEVDWGENFHTVMCNGCETVSLLEERWCSEDYADEPQRYRYPKEEVLMEPEWLELLNDPHGKTRSVYVMLKEVYPALNNGLFQLASMGIRAALDRMMVEQGASAAVGFGTKLNFALETGLISSRQKDFLLKVLEIGDAAIHRDHEPTQADLVSMLAIIDTIVRIVYIHEEDLKNLSPVPPDPRKQKV